MKEISLQYLILINTTCIQWETQLEHWSWCGKNSSNEMCDVPGNNIISIIAIIILPKHLIFVNQELHQDHQCNLTDQSHSYPSFFWWICPNWLHYLHVSFFFFFFE
jgi:hypothetical protein